MGHFTTYRPKHFWLDNTSLMQITPLDHEGSHRSTVSWALRYLGGLVDAYGVPVSDWVNLFHVLNLWPSLFRLLSHILHHPLLTHQLTLHRHPTPLSLILLFFCHFFCIFLFYLHCNPLLYQGLTLILLYLIFRLLIDFYIIFLLLLFYWATMSFFCFLG